MQFGFSPSGAKWLVCFALSTAALAAAASAVPAHSVAIVNKTRTVMVSLQLRPTGTTAWLSDVLGHNPLGVQKQIAIAVPAANCVFDLYAGFEDGHHKIKSHVDLCKLQKLDVTDY